MIELDDLDAVCETIALAVGLGEDAIDLDEGIADLADVGSTAGTSAGQAVARLRRTRVVRSDEPFEITSGPGGNQRL